MREIGVIVSAQDEIVQVQIAKGERCVGCHSCVSLKPNLMQVEARNDIRAEVGKVVEVEIQARHVLGYAFLVFIFPILMMITGYLLAMRIANGRAISGEGSGILGAIAGFALAFLAIRVIDTQWGRAHKSAARVVGYAAGPPETCISISPVK